MDIVFLWFNQNIIKYIILFIFKFLNHLSSEEQVWATSSHGNFHNSQGRKNNFFSLIYSHVC